MAKRYSLIRSDLTFRYKKAACFGNTHNTVSVICENTNQEFPSAKAASDFFEIPCNAVVHSCRERMYCLNYKGLAFNYKPLF